MDIKTIDEETQKWRNLANEVVWKVCQVSEGL